MGDRSQDITSRLALRPKEAAEALGVSERKLRDWMRNEGLPFVRLNAVVLIPRRGLEEWIAERTTDDHQIDAAVDQILDGLGR
jgi:excisionase family DNA binding protein